MTPKKCPFGLCWSGMRHLTFLLTVYESATGCVILQIGLLQNRIMCDILCVYWHMSEVYVSEYSHCISITQCEQSLIQHTLHWKRGLLTVGIVCQYSVLVISNEFWTQLDKKILNKAIFHVIRSYYLREIRVSNNLIKAIVIVYIK